MVPSTPDCKQKKFAVICANGIGDALLMMTVAYQLKRGGHIPTLFHDKSAIISPLFDDTISIQNHPPLSHLETVLSSFDFIVLENDHSKRAYFLLTLRNEKKIKNLIVLFPKPSSQFRKTDFLFDPKLPVLTNLTKSCRNALKLKNVTSENGLCLPNQKNYRSYPNRIVIHPSSQDPKRKSWSLPRFLKLAQTLKNQGYFPVFTVSPKERPFFHAIEDSGVDLISLSHLSDLSAYIYASGFFIGNDSGIGHLASNLKIPTLTISGHPKRIRLWRPNWHKGLVVTPLFPLPNFKGIGLAIRENAWSHFISIKRTLKAFNQLKEIA